MVISQHDNNIIYSFNKLTQEFLNDNSKAL